MMKRTTMAWSAREWLGAVALVAAVFLAYWPVWQAGFVWDDHAFVEKNPYLVGARGLHAIWTSSAADICPLTLSTFWMEHQLWGVAPLPYHLVNLLQHAACAVLLWRVLLALGVPCAWLGAALWALHPVNVESVAWVFEMKNTESTLFFLPAILFFIRGLKQDARAATWNYGFAFLFAALAMAAKSSTVVLPGVLLLVAWWIEGRWIWRNLVRVAPIIALAALATVVSLWTQSFVLAAVIDPALTRPWPERFATAGIAIWFYLGKLLWPIPVMTGYPRWNVDITKAISWLPLLAMPVMMAVLWLKRGSWSRAPFFAFAYFVGVLLPVLGLFDNFIFQYSIVFDHFQYLPSTTPLALVGAALVRLTQGWPRARSLLAAAVLLVLGTLTWFRVETFTNEEKLWSHTVAENPESWLAQENLAIALDKDGRQDEALQHYQKAIEIYPGYPDGHINQGLLYFNQGRIDDAMAEFRTALKFNPKSGEAYNDIGNALLKQGRQDEALAAFEQAAKVNPALSNGDYNAGRILYNKGQVDLAIEAYKRALAADPNLAEGYYSLGLAFMKKGDVDKAIIGFQRSLELAPNNADAYGNLGRALVQKGQLNDGVIQYQKALEIDPKSAATESNLGVALFQAGLRGEAMKHLRKSLELDPNSDEANNNLGNALLATAQPNEAIAQYQKALALNPAFSDARRNLAVAYLYTGRPVEAITQLQQVIKDYPTDSVSQGLLTKAQELAKQKPTAK